MALLLYFIAFGWTLVLFASLFGMTCWILIKLFQWLTESPDPTNQLPHSREGWNPNHLKRAGQ